MQEKHLSMSRMQSQIINLILRTFNTKLRIIVRSVDIWDLNLLLWTAEYTIMRSGFCGCCVVSIGYAVRFLWWLCCQHWICRPIFVVVVLSALDMHLIYITFSTSYQMVQDSRVKTQLIRWWIIFHHLISCVSTVLSCSILLYLSQRRCRNLRFSTSFLGTRSEL